MSSLHFSNYFIVTFLGCCCRCCCCLVCRVMFFYFSTSFVQWIHRSSITANMNTNVFDSLALLFSSFLYFHFVDCELRHIPHNSNTTVAVALATKSYETRQTQLCPSLHKMHTRARARASMCSQCSCSSANVLCVYESVTTCVIITTKWCERNVKRNFQKERARGAACAHVKEREGYWERNKTV